MRPLQGSQGSLIVSRSRGALNYGRRKTSVTGKMEIHSETNLPCNCIVWWSLRSWMSMCQKFPFADITKCSNIEESWHEGRTVAASPFFMIMLLQKYVYANLI